LVALGLAQPLIDFVLWMHFIKPVFAIEPFNPGRAGIVVIVTATLGYVVGYLFAQRWNSLSGARGWCFDGSDPLAGRSLRRAARRL
jgi:hypothetical protein